MAIEIKTSSLEPLRHTFDNVARRQGADKPASRYLEAMYDLQPEVNFHYRPYWDSKHALYDAGRTAITMEDWYVFKDPRQFYYGSWVLARAKQQEAAERSFAFVDKRKLAANMAPEWRDKVVRLLVPLRHLEYGANLNNCYVAAYGFGTAITQAAMFMTVDRMGIAQFLSRIGLALDGGNAESLDVAKQHWLEDAAWQPLRRLTEDLLVTRDWFELLVAQDFVLDGLLYPLAYQRFDGELANHTGAAVSMLTEFMTNWFAESSRWIDMVLKTAAAQSDANKAQIEQWVDHWSGRCIEALAPVAEQMLGTAAAVATLAELKDELAQRAAKKCGLDVAASAVAAD